MAILDREQYNYQFEDGGIGWNDESVYTEPVVTEPVVTAPVVTAPVDTGRWEWIWNGVEGDRERGVLRNTVTGEERYTDWRPLGDKEAIRALAEPLGASLNNEPVSADFTNWLSGYNQRLADAEAARIAEANRVAADKAAADAANAAAAAAFADYWNRLFNPNPAPVVAEPAPATPVVAEPAPVTPTPATPAQVEAFNQLLQPPPPTPAPIPWVDRAKMINPNFDAAGYAARYSDLANAFGNDAEKLAEHFVNYGERENRNPTAYTPKEKIATQLISQWQGLGTNVGIGSAGTPQAEIGGRPLQTVADEFAQKLVDKGITDLSQAKFDAGSQVSWTAEGNGNVSLIASPDGRLIPVWGSSSDASAIRSAAIGIALTFTGAGAAIGGAITSSLGVAASAATQALIGNIVVNTALNGGDIGAAVKGAIISSVGAEVGSMVGDAAKTMFDSAEGVKLISNVANNATKAVLSGGDAESVIVNTLVQGAVDFGTSKIPGFSDLPAPVKSTITQSINAAVQGKDIDYGTMLANAAKEGLLSYGLSQIPQFKDADTKTQSFITTMLRTAINDGDLSQSAVNWAVGQANQEFQRVLKAGPALDELKKAGVISEASYYALNDDQKRLVDSFATQSNPQAAAANYVNSLTTTDDEIKQFYKQITGKDATDEETDLLKTFVGMDEASAKVGLDNQIRANIAADELRLTKLQDVLRDPEATDQDLLTVMNEYTITPSFIQRIMSKSYNDLVVNMKGVTAGEAEAFADKANLERPLTPDEVAMMQSGTRAQAANFAQRLSDLDQVTFRGDVFADQGAAELAAKQAGYNSYIYDGQTYMVNDRNIAASFDGGLLKETMRLITGALKAQGLTWEQAPPEKLQQLVNSAHALYGNDVGALKGASIQDFLNGNTGTFDDIKTAYNNSLQGDGFRVEVRGVGYTSDTPDAQVRALPYLPPGVQLASSQEAFESNGATPIILSNGSVAWVKSKELPSQMDAVDANVEILSPESASSTAPLQYLDYTSKLDPNKSTVNVSVINGAKAVVDAINKYGGGNAAALTDFASVVAQGSGELVKLASDLAWASGMVQRDNIVSRTADWLSKYGASIQSANTKQQEDNITNAVKAASGVVEKSKAFFRAAKDNPLGALTMVGKEAVQEVPMLVASGGVGRIVSGIAGKAIGFWAATGTDSVLNAGESFSANFGETYDNIKRAGGSDEYAKSQAYKSGAQAAVIGFGSNLIADSALVKAFMGEATKITAGTFAKQAGKQYVTEWGGEFLQNASVQYNSFGKVDWDQAQTAGAIGGAIGMGVASGIMSASAINYNMQVAVDSLGRPATLQQVMDGSVQIQPGSFNAQAPIFDINGVAVSFDNFNKVTNTALEQSDFSFDAYSANLKSLVDQGIPAGSASDVSLAVTSATDANTLAQSVKTLGLTEDQALTAANIKFNDQVTTAQEVQAAFAKQQDFVPSQQDIAALVGVKDQSQIDTAVADYIAPKYTTTQEAEQFFKDAGYKPTQEEIQQFVGQKADADQQTAISNYAAQNILDAAEVKAAAAQEGITLTDEQAQQYVRQAPEKQAEAELRTQLDPSSTTLDEAVQFLVDSGFTLPQAQAAAVQFVSPTAETEVQKQVAAYTDPRQITFDEAKKLLTDLGYTPTNEEVQQFVRQSGDEIAQQVAQEAGTYIDPRVVTEQEAKDAYAALGLTNPTQEDIAKLTGQYQESELAGKAQSSLDEARYNATLDRIGQVQSQLTTAINDAKSAGVTGDAALDLAIQKVASDLGTSKEVLLGQIGKTEDALRTDFAAQLGTVTTELGNVESRLSTAIEAAKDAGLQGDAALQKAIDTVASDLGTTKEALLGQIGKTETQLRTDFATELSGVREELGLVESRLATAIQDARDEGMTGDAALQSAIDAVSLELGTSREVLLGQIGKTETQLRNDFATELGGVRTELGNVESRLSAAIDAAKDAGISGDAVLQKAIDSVAADLGTSRDALLTQIGKTEETLRTDFAAQIAGVTTELGNVESRLTKAIDDAKASGLDSDAALQDAIDSVASDLGITKEALLGQIGKTEDQLRSDFSTQLGAVTTELGNVEIRLNAAIDAAIASGLKGDAALDAAIQSVSDDLGTTKEALLGQIGKTETQLRSDFETQLGAVTTELGNVENRLATAIDAAKEAGLKGDEALQAAIDSVAADMGTTKDALLEQIGKTETQLRSDFSTELGAVKTELGAVESRLSDAIDAARKEGMTGDAALQDAIDAVALELGTSRDVLLGQIGKTEDQLRTDFSTQLSVVTTELGNVETRLNAAIDAAKAAGLDGDAALDAAIQSVSDDLGTTKEALLGQIGKTEEQLRSDFATQLSAVTTELGSVENRLKTAIDDAKAQGLAGDEALQSAIDAVAEDLGTSREALLGQIGKTETQLRSDFSTQLGAVTTELGNVETRLRDAISAAEESGLSRDQAIQAALDSVAADLGLTKIDLLSQIGKTEEALRSEFQTGLTGVEGRLAQAIQDAKDAGLQGDAALQSAIDTVSAQLGTTKEDLLGQIGKTETQLRSDFATQLGAVSTELGNVETRLQDAIAAAEARGLTRDQAIQSALDTVASDLGTTKADLLTQIGTTESTLRGEIEASQQALGEQIGSTEQRLTQAIADAEARGLTRDQAIQAGLDQVASDLGTTRQDLLTQLGQTQSALSAEIKTSQETLGQQIVSTEQRVTDAIAAAEARGLTRDQAIQAGLDQVATDLGTTRQDVLAQLGTTADTLRGELAAAQTALGQQITTGLGGLSTDLAAAEARINERATQYEAAGLSRDQALSRAVGEVASQLGTTAQNLQQQISTAQTQLGEQIAGTKTELQKQIDEAAELLGKPAQRVTQADLDYIDSVIKGTVTTAPDLSYDVNRDGKIDQTDFDYLQRVSTGSTGGGGAPPEFQPGTRWAPTGLFGEISGLRTDITTQLQQQELKRQQDAAKAKAEEEAARRRQTGLEMLKTPTAAAKQEALPQVSPLQTSGPSKFISPLAGFLAAVETGSYLQPKPQQPTMTPQPQQAQTDRYAYGKEQSIDSLLDPYGEQKQDQQSPFGFKAGGLAMGGGTRYGRFAAGGLNMVHHSGKARVDFRKGDAVTGPGDGQSDDIPAMLADGEFVFPADVVAALGNGSTKAGSDKLYDMMHSIRAHARSSGPKDLPPPAKSPLEYLKGAKQKSARR